MSKEIEGLTKILDAVQEQKIYACIVDLLSNGIVAGRFEDGEPFPSRQDVTRFFLSWLKQCGVPADRCRDWMIDYCERELSRISSSSPSRIRHSTKSLIKYIYGSEDVTFDCGCEQNRLKATCSPGCPVYDEMKKKHEISKQQFHDAVNYVRPTILPPAEPALQVKERYKEQFEKAMEVVRERLDQVSSLEEMKRYLNDQGYKTRTGKFWKIGNLQREIKEHGLKWSRKNDLPGKADAALKDQYRAQYQEAVKLITKLYGEGVKVDEILDVLEARGYKTITGIRWTEGNIRNMITKFRKQ